MKRSLVHELIENSKYNKSVSGEIGKVDYTNQNTPDNHTSGKKGRVVDGTKGLGDRKTSRSPQVDPPKKREKRNQLGEDLGNNPDRKAEPVTSKAKNKDEGMKTPKANKMGAVARKASTSKNIGDHIKNGANIGKAPKLPKGYTGGERVEVQKIREGLKELEDLLGEPIRLDENYPDDFSGSRFDAHYGTGDDDQQYEEGMVNMKHEVKAALEKEGHDYIADYKKYINHPEAKEDPAWYLEHLQGMVEHIGEVAHSALNYLNDHGEFEVETDVVKPIIVNFMKANGVADEHIPEAFVDYMSEDFSGSFNPNSLSNDIETADDQLLHRGYRVMGGGFTNGEINYKYGNEIVSIRVHSFRPKEIVGWSLKSGAKGKTVDELVNTLDSQHSSSADNNAPNRTIWDRLTGRNKTKENASGSAVASDAIPASTVASGGHRSQLFADADEPTQNQDEHDRENSTIDDIIDQFKISIEHGEDDTLDHIEQQINYNGDLHNQDKIELKRMIDDKRAVGEAHGTSHAYVQFSRIIDDTNEEGFLYDIENELKHDRRLTHDEIDELQAMIYRKIRNGIEEDESDMMPRSKYHVGRAKAMTMKMADDLPRGVSEDDDPCWDSHKMVGMKTKNGKKVPNCVPKESVDPNSFEVSAKPKRK